MLDRGELVPTDVGELVVVPVVAPAVDRHRSPDFDVGVVVKLELGAVVACVLVDQGDASDRVAGVSAREHGRADAVAK